MVLHQVFNSPFKSTSLQRCVAQCDGLDSLLLLQDAVYTVNHALIHQIIAKKLKLYILHTDLLARGLAGNACLQINQSEIQVINDQQWVDLCLENKHVVSWT